MRGAIVRHKAWINGTLIQQTVSLFPWEAAYLCLPACSFNLKPRCFTFSILSHIDFFPIYIPLCPWLHVIVFCFLSFLCISFLSQVSRAQLDYLMKLSIIISLGGKQERQMKKHFLVLSLYSLFPLKIFLLHRPIKFCLLFSAETFIWFIVSHIKWPVSHLSHSSFSNVRMWGASVQFISLWN